MSKVEYFVKPDDALTKSAYLLFHHDISILPVIDEKRKLVGVIRTIEIFKEIAFAVLNPEEVRNSL